MHSDTSNQATQRRAVVERLMSAALHEPVSIDDLIQTMNDE